MVRGVSPQPKRSESFATGKIPTDSLSLVSAAKVHSWSTAYWATTGYKKHCSKPPFSVRGKTPIPFPKATSLPLPEAGKHLQTSLRHVLHNPEQNYSCLSPLSSMNFVYACTGSIQGAWYSYWIHRCTKMKDSRFPCWLLSESEKNFLGSICNWELHFESGIYKHGQ